MRGLEFLEDEDVLTVEPMRSPRKKDRQLLEDLQRKDGKAQRVEHRRQRAVKEQLHHT